MKKTIAFIVLLPLIILVTPLALVITPVVLLVWLFDWALAQFS